MKHFTQHQKFENRIKLRQLASLANVLFALKRHSFKNIFRETL